MTVGRRERAIADAVIDFGTFQMRWFRDQGRAFMAGFEKLRSLYESDPESPKLGIHIEQLISGQSDTTHPAWIEEWQSAVSDTLRLGAGDLAEDLGQPRSIAEAAGAKALTELPDGLSFRVTQRPEVHDYIANQGAKRVAGIDDATMKEMRTILNRAVTDGDSYSSLAREIKNRWGEYATKATQQHLSTRAELIATTELAEAYESGRLALGRELQDFGMKMEKSWLTAADDRVDEDCEGNAAEDWIPLDDAFSSGDDMPPAHPACRCDGLIQTA